MTIADYPVVGYDDIAWLTEEQMIEVDRVMMEDLQIGLIQMMENAGRNLAQLVLDRFNPRTVTVLAGSGGNGGGGLVAARHLANRGVAVSVTLGKEASEFSGVPAHQKGILQRMGVDISSEPRTADIAIDALIGYSLKGAPRGRIGELIEQASGIGERIVSLDTPSGINVTDGSVPGAAIVADATLTLALPKIGLRSVPGVGELYLGDISVPSSVYSRMEVAPAPDFRRGSLLRLNPGAETESQ